MNEKDKEGLMRLLCDVETGIMMMCVVYKYWVYLCCSGYTAASIHRCDPTAEELSPAPCPTWAGDPSLLDGKAVPGSPRSDVVFCFVFLTKQNMTDTCEVF